MPSLQKLRIVAGNAGLDRTIRWVHVLDMPDVAKWVTGGELLFMTGISLKSPMELMKIVPELAAKKVAGLAITRGQYVPEIPKEVIDLAESLDFPIFEFPWEVKLVEVFKEISTYINDRQADEKLVQDTLRNLVFGDIEDPEISLSRAASCGYDLGEPCQIMVVSLGNLDEQAAKAGEDEAAGEIRDRFAKVVLDVLKNRHIRPIYLQWLKSIILLMPGRRHGRPADEVNKSIALQCIEAMGQMMPGLIVNVGIGEVCPDAREVRKSLHQAQQALRYSAQSTESKIYEYAAMGVNKLLLELGPDVLASFYRDYVLNIRDYDREHGTDLLGNLEVFLQSNGNLSDAAQKLYIHRNTLIYRIKKIEDLTGKSLEDFQHMMSFYIGIITAKYHMGDSSQPRSNI